MLLPQVNCCVVSVLSIQHMYSCCVEEHFSLNFWILQCRAMEQFCKLKLDSY